MQPLLYTGTMQFSQVEMPEGLSEFRG